MRDFLPENTKDMEENTKYYEVYEEIYDFIKDFEYKQISI